MKALLISPYLDVLGGGEKYLLSIGRYLSENNYLVELAWKNKTIKSAIINQFGNQYDFININSHWPTLHSWQRLLKSRAYDVIFYHSDGSYFFSLAKKNFQLFQVPEEKLIPSHNLLTQLKFSFWTPVFNSRFTARFFLKHQATKKHFLLYPKTENFLKTMPKKSRLILSVARFFGHLHSKKQEVLIKAFISGMKKYPEFKNYSLVLAGGFKKEDQSYLQYLKKLIKNHNNIEIKTNLTYSQIQELYKKAQFFWHGAGYNINEQKQPSLVEHFGISIVEAMASFCVPFVYPAGGPKEIVRANYNGLFFQSPAQLAKLTSELIINKSLYHKMAEQARKTAETKFGNKVFKNSLEQMLS